MTRPAHPRKREIITFLKDNRHLTFQKAADLLNVPIHIVAYYDRFYVRKYKVPGDLTKFLRYCATLHRFGDREKRWFLEAADLLENQLGYGE